MIKRNKGILISIAIVLSLGTVGCNSLEYSAKKMNEALNGTSAIVQTYDEESQLIDKIEGKSISIKADKDFSIKDSDGKEVEKVWSS